jgi:hypothetical protein
MASLVSKGLAGKLYTFISPESALLAPRYQRFQPDQEQEQIDKNRGPGMSLEQGRNARNGRMLEFVFPMIVLLRHQQPFRDSAGVDVQENGVVELGAALFV